VIHVWTIADELTGRTGPFEHPNLSAKRLNVGAIAGGVVSTASRLQSSLGRQADSQVGGVLALTILLALLWFNCIRKRCIIRRVDPSSTNWRDRWAPSLQS
jgi:hypothetical protein